MPAVDRELVLGLTRAWIEEVVIAHRLCPFAARPYDEDDVLLEILPLDRASALAAVYRRAAQMASAALPETTLLIGPAGLESLAAFGAFQETAERLLEESFPDVFVTASFHPRYTFAEVDPSDASHYVHRSPYPVLQLLRKGQVAFAKTRYDVAALLNRNSATAARLGSAFFERYLATDSSPNSWAGGDGSRDASA